MFGNLNKPAFGTSTPGTSFGFGASTPTQTNPFGQSQIFGKPAGGFGSPSTSAFGQPTNSLFPATQPQSTGLFQNANTGFGTAVSTQSGFGTTNLFGQQQQQQPTSGVQLFNTTSTFGQQNKPTGFGFGTQATQPGLFGQTQQQQQQQPTSLFQPAANNLFGSSNAFGQQSTGTGTVKFNPVTGTDTMLKNGVATSINTKHHSITCMKEYENKSFEELRFEDYAANRKGPQNTLFSGPQQQTGFGTTPFGGASTAPALFGQTDASKTGFTGFGQQSTPAFGQNTGFGQQQSSSLFGKPTTGFGTTTSQSNLGFGFNNNNTQAGIMSFGANQQPKSFGTSAPSIFGTNTATTQSTGFGGGGLFGQTNTQNTGVGLFGKPAQPAPGFGTTQNNAFSFSTTTSTQASSLFQPAKPLFGQSTTTPAFGQTNTFGGGGFGNSFGKPVAPAFGTTTTPAFGTTLGGGLQPQNTSLFGNTAAKPGGLFTNNSATGLFNNTNTSFQPNTSFSLQTQPAQQSMFPSADQQLSTNLALLTADPFGDAPHLAGLEPKLKNNSPNVSVTNPKELKSLLDGYKTADDSHTLKPKIIPIRSTRDNLFESVSPTLNGDHNSKEYVKTNCRRLILKNRPTSGVSGQSPGIMKMDILKQIMSSTTNDENLNPATNTSDLSIQSEIKKAPLKLSFDNTLNEDPVNQTGSFGSQTSFLMDNSSISKHSISLEKNPKKSTVDVEVETDINDINAMGDSASRHPCNIICTRPEYYTLPSLEELSNYIDENGRCIVKGFTIGRKGYGNVYFPDEMDVYGLNIDELVHFRYREINVYPDDEKKPPVGQGLNRKAQVTLDNVYPKQSNSHALVTDINELLKINFAEKLRRITMNKNAKFVDYRPETGSWVFKVDHFSKYGFDDNDEESIQKNGQDGGADKKLETAKKSEVALQAKVTTDKPIEKEALSQSLTKELETYGIDIDDEIFMEEGTRYRSEADVRRSMFVDISDDDYHLPSELPLHHHDYNTSKNIQVMKSTLFADDDRSSDGGGSHISIIRQYLDIPDEIRTLPMITEEVSIRKKVILRPKVEKVYNINEKELSTNLKQMRSYQDLAIFKGKSFKVGWSKGFRFYNVVQKQEGGTELVLSDIQCGSTKKFEPKDEILNDSLEIVLEESTFTLDSNQIPTYTIIKNHSYLKKQKKLFEKLLKEYDNKETRYLHSIWTLADALWGPTENTPWNRRHLLSEWLKFNTDYESIDSNDSIKTIFDKLSIYRINEAANIALEKRYPNLALIISQLSVTNNTKLFLQEQIENWYKSMTSQHINDTTKKIYLLLAGTPIREEVNIFEDIDWKRALGMHLWYVSPVGAPIEMVIEMYKKAFEEYTYASSPNPPYRTTYEEDGSFDLLFHILILYYSKAHRLSTVLDSSTHTDDYLDYWLSWLLLQLFTSLDVGIMEESEKTKLCTSFSNQLESLGKWEWAIFVLLQLEDNSIKRNLVLGVLDRNLSCDVDKSTIKVENNLVNKMRVPSEWIHSVKGDKALANEKYFQAFNHFAQARDYCKANDILVEHLLPVLFVNEQYDIIKILISEIEEGSNDIERWNNEAGLFRDFIELQEKYVTSDDNLRIQMSLQSIGNRITSFVSSNNHQKLCLAEMSKRCCAIYKEFCRKTHYSAFKNSYLEFIENLNMPPDFKQIEALYAINEIK